MNGIATGNSKQVVSAEAGYALWADTYDVDPNPLLAAEERAFNPWLESVAGRAALDVACGTGRWLERLVRAGAKPAAGIDLSQAMLGAARAKPLLEGHVVRGDCLALPFRSEAADFIICSFALSHISGLQTFARELARAARREAHLWVSDLHPEARAQGWTTGFRHKGGTAQITAVPHTAERIRGSFEAAGFVLIECEELRLGEPEKPIFERAGKSHLFERACEAPAVGVWRFKRTGFAPPAKITDGR